MRYPLRISQEVWEELERWARDDLRSVNGQIEFILRQSIQERRGTRLVPLEPQVPPDDEGNRRSP
jgi:hypothetical protein